ncbi:hypothetical protein BGZ46_002200 [Entomortierella lignicola]|nr:hypothetical protein BGZ46_002200 [Entomortierella lignicola]
MDEIPDLRIPEEFLSIESRQQITLPPTRPVFNNWILSQISHARDLFQKQNYMQALVVIDKVKEHDYMKEFFKDPSLATSVARRHLEDLNIVEYCCRLVCTYEDQHGNINMVETLENLNSTVLKPIPALQTRSRIDYRTTFQLSRDPLLDFTLAILTRSWNQLSNGLEYQFLPQGASAEQIALASAASTFLKSLINRRLFPSNLSVLQDSAISSGSVPTSRRAVLEMCLSNNDQMSGMQWIWLWDRRDRKDWLEQWSQPEFQQWLVMQFLECDRPDWAIDLFRLVSRASGTPQSWVQDLLAATSNIPTPALAKRSQFVEEILRFSNMDAGAFSKKKEYYNLSSWKYADQLQSWLVGLQEVGFDAFQSKNPVEQYLWREMAMVGIFSRFITREDIINSLSPGITATICSSDLPIQSIGGLSGIAPSSNRYCDALTDYLDEKAINGLDISSIRSKTGMSQLHSSPKLPEAFILLKRAIQEIMSKYCVEDRSSWTALDTYRSLLHDIAHNTSFRLGNMSLISHATEARFYALYGRDVWDKTASAIKTDAKSSKQSEEQALKEYTVLTLPEVRDYISSHIHPTVAKMSASTIYSAGSPMTAWEGKFSDWFLALTSASPTTGPIARNLQHNAYLAPGTLAYDLTMKSLLNHNELDLAINLHSHAYGLSVIKGELQTETKWPSVKEFEMIIKKLATSDKDSQHLDRAQWIFNQYLEKELALADLGSVHGKQRLINISVVTELVGAWCRRAQFSNARDVVKVMWDQGLQPNMVFYNTILKSLVDLTPCSKAGGRSIGLGKRAGMRELGREIMVRRLLRSRGLSDSGEALEEDVAKIVRSELDYGWDLLHEIISTASEKQAKRIHLQAAYGMDSPSMLKRLISQAISLSHSDSDHNDTELRDGQFRPDAYTFSILLDAFAHKGEIDSISELFVDMKHLNLEPDSVICSILANAFAKKGDLRALDRVIHAARSRHIDPGLYLANAILDSLVEKGVSASKIRETLDYMIAGTLGTEAQNMYPDGETEIMVRKLARHRAGTQKRSGVASNGLTDTNMVRPFELDPGLDAVTLTTLIKYHTRQNDTASAQDLVQLMVQAGFVPDNRVYVLLLAASIRKQDIAIGLETVQAMRAYSKIFPDGKAWKGLLRCALELESCPSSKGNRQQVNQPSSGSSSSSPQENSQSIANDTIQDQQREQPVISVLKELSKVLDEIEAEATLNGKQGHLVSKEYLLKILMSSWISLSEGNMNEVSKSDAGEANSGSIIQNPEVKGKNGLLRRLLNHMLRVQGGSRRRGRMSKKEQQPRDANLESALEIEQRCEHAIWLVRLVESHGIELGQRWKWDVVIPRIQSLTGQKPAVIMKQLGGARHYLWRKQRRKEDTS